MKTQDTINRLETILRKAENNPYNRSFIEIINEIVFLKENLENELRGIRKILTIDETNAEFDSIAYETSMKEHLQAIENIKELMKKPIVKKKA